MRNGSGLGSLLLGAGIGIMAGYMIALWMNPDETKMTKKDQPDINLNKEEIANLAQQFLNLDDKKTINETIH